MNPEDKVLLERTLKLSEENNQILRKMQRAARWAILWSFVKVLIVIVPLILGYFFLQPFFGDLSKNYGMIKSLLDGSLSQ